MKATPEGKVKTTVKHILDTHVPIWYYMPVPSGYGQHGVPDFVCCVAGHFLGIECKAGKNKLTPLQISVSGKIRNALGCWLTINESNTSEVHLHVLRLGAIPK